MIKELSEKGVSQAWFNGDVHMLRAEVERLQALVRDVSATRDTAVNMKLERDAEIERLKIENNDRVTRLLTQIIAMRGEIEQLRAEKISLMTRDNEMERAWEERDTYLQSNVKLVAEIEQLRAYKTAADAYLMGLNDHLHGENLRCDLVALRANWDAARDALE